MKKAPRETQTLCAGCSKSEPTFFAPLQIPFPEVQGRPTIESAGDSHYLHLQTQFGEDRCMQFRVIVVTDPQTNTDTNGQDRL